MSRCSTWAAAGGRSRCTPRSTARLGSPRSRSRPSRAGTPGSGCAGSVSADRARVLIQDYRDTAGGPYDAIASLEMGEHVGADGYPAFCASLRDLLRPGGRLLIQQMSRGGNAPGGGAFIESYVTADMHMRPVGETVGLLEERRPRGARRPGAAAALRAHDQGLARQPGGEPARGRGHHRPGARPDVAAVPGGRRAGVRRGPDGRRPDPRGEARNDGRRRCSP